RPLDEPGEGHADREQFAAPDSDSAHGDECDLHGNPPMGGQRAGMTATANATEPAATAVAGRGRRNRRAGRHAARKSPAPKRTPPPIQRKAPRAAASASNAPMVRRRRANTPAITGSITALMW